ncbi:hypothetical protein EK904_002950 [Melospiza melodia maxima]|nr:hypothetical protein EK904_002950 [Melospiza melodia maxima]
MLSDHPVKAKPQSFTSTKRQTVSSRSTPAEEKQSQEAPRALRCAFIVWRGEEERVQILKLQKSILTSAPGLLSKNTSCFTPHWCQINQCMLHGQL